VTARPPLVVFLHGMARSRHSMRGIRARVAGAGYDTWARTYPSRRMPLEQLAETVADWIRQQADGRQVLGVTHSLGGVLARQMQGLLPWRGLVMVAPPNAGSRVAARLRDRPLFRWVYGPAGQQVAGPGDWPLPRCPFAVIAGTRGLALGNPTSWLTRALGILPPDVPSDGTVAVDEARLPGMTHFATVDASHTWILDHPRTRELVLGYLARFRAAVV
jgi:triacylglycerol esterase/lipase EstA (alpha/beta hydrolase family)